MHAARFPGTGIPMRTTSIRSHQQLVTAIAAGIVVAGNMHKFRPHPALREFLVGTGSRVLVEASPEDSPEDSIRGIGLEARAAAPRKWKGLNLPGFALMEVRDARAAGTAHRH